MLNWKENVLLAFGGSGHDHQNNGDSFDKRQHYCASIEKVLDDAERDEHSCVAFWM